MTKDDRKKYKEAVKKLTDEEIPRAIIRTTTSNHRHRKYLLKLLFLRYTKNYKTSLEKYCEEKKLNIKDYSFSDEVYLHAYYDLVLNPPKFTL